MNISPEVQKVAEKNRAIYEHLHRNPQIGFQETVAHEVILREAKNLNLEYEVVAKTGVLVTIPGKKNTQGAVSGIRADMDALPIHEQTDLPYRSLNDGYMHACGHDLHTTAALTAMRVLAENNDFDGMAKILFQPAEEGLGGADAIIASDILRKHKVQRLFGMHIWPQKPLGTVEVHKGPVMAASASFEIHIYGQGGHVALAREKNLKSALKLIAPVYRGLDQIYTDLKNKYPEQAFTIQVSNIHTGDQEAFNVIQPYAYICGSVRGFKQSLLKEIQSNIQQIIKDLAEPADYQSAFDWSPICMVTINTDAEARLATDIFTKIMGPDNVDTNPDPKRISEDFGNYSALKQPDGSPMGLMFALIGQKDENHPYDKTRPYDLHHPKMKSNPKLIAIGAQYFVDAVKQSMHISS